MTAFGRAVTWLQAVQAGRNARTRICRVNVGYDWTNPSLPSSSNRVTDHKCGSSTSLAVT